MTLNLTIDDGDTETVESKSDQPHMIAGAVLFAHMVTKHAQSNEVCLARMMNAFRNVWSECGEDSDTYIEVLEQVIISQAITNSGAADE